MWCPTCQAEVAAELTADQRRLLCVRCHSELALSATEPLRGGGVRISHVEHSARDLLARWSADSLLEQPTTESAQKVEPAAESIRSTAADSIPIVNPEPQVTLPIASLQASPGERARRRRRLRLRVQPEPTESAPPDKLWMTNVAQLTAYGGVAGLTYGAALVLWSRFGGPADYASTGWLLTTIGQMLLFLGLVTLVSSSLERLQRRLTDLTEQLRRAETIRQQKPPRDRANDDRPLTRAA